MTLSLFGPGPCTVQAVASTLDRDHYLGSTDRGIAWRDEFGCLVLASPTSRHMPCDWLELSRWCLVGRKNGGSKQWKAALPWVRSLGVTTVISYSDPSAKHTGALYRACGWLWAPTWHRLRPPPSQGGTWDGITLQAVKDRWVYPLAPDARRMQVLCIKEQGLLKRYPWAEWREPKFRRGRLVGGTGGCDFQAFKRETA
jgi:hypothetical protein